MKKGHKYHAKDGVRTRRALVHVRAADMALRITTLKNFKDLIDARNKFLLQPRNEKTLLQEAKCS